MDGKQMAGDRAGTLVRVSSGGQDEANQVPEVERHCTGRAYRVISQCQWSLHDKSASKGEQQATLDAIIEAVRAGVIKVLVVWKPSRIERRGTEYLCRFVRLVREAGGRVERADTGATLHENDIHTILDGYMDHQYAETISVNTRLAHNHIAFNKAFRGREPFGLKITGPKYDKKLTVCEEHRATVRKIFQAVTDGESLIDICIWLDSLGCKTAKTTIFERDGNGKIVTDDQGEKVVKYSKGDPTTWWPAMLMRLIRHPAYSGTYYVKHTDADGKLATYKHKCEAIVTRREQDDAIRALSTREKRGVKSTDSSAMLKGVIRCGNPECDATGSPDSPMYPIKPKPLAGQAERQVFYRCAGRGSKRHGCGTMVPMTLVDAAVNRIIAETFNVPVKRYVLVQGHDWAEEIQEIKDQMRELDPDAMSDDEYDDQMKQLRAERDRLNALPADEDQLLEIDTDENYATVYAALSTGVRGDWLKSKGFTVRASRSEVRVMQGTTGAIVTL